MLYASVRILGVPYAADKSYAYHIPAHLEEKVTPGSLVVVPFGGGNRTTTALVESVSDTAEVKKTKPVMSVPGKYLYIPKELAQLCRFLSDRLLCAIGDAVKCVLPAGLGVRKTYFYSPDPSADGESTLQTLNLAAADVYSYIKNERRVPERALKAYIGPGGVSAADSLVKLGLCVKETDFECTVNTKAVRCYEPVWDDGVPEALASGKIRLTSRQQNAYEALVEAASPLTAGELAAASGVSSAVMSELVKKGVARVTSVEKDRSLAVLDRAAFYDHGDFTLEPEQNEALEKLAALYRDDKPRAALLYGVTGSGKTNVILKLMEQVLADGKTVLVLVPEIALTAQTVGRFAARFADRGIALIHSGLSAGERIDAWKRITEGTARIVIGTRSAVFAPLDHIGLIVIDEEHESSFKSDQSPKYHARDVAKFRCNYHNALLVLASATPSVESFYYASTGRYELVTLKKRYGKATLPTVELYDMRSEPPYEMPDDEFTPASDPPTGSTGVDVIWEDGGLTFKEADRPKDPASGAVPKILGENLKKCIAETLADGKQAILFIGRRGYRALAVCRSCGHTFTCPNCSVSLTLHRYKQTGRDRLICHYCGYTEPVPAVCPACGKERISFVGSGTQMLEETLKKHFPAARILRMDADTTSGKFGHEKILDAFRAGEADILVGTQMVAKGHDFPDVALVGVVMADTSLFVGDFRAGERTFSLITQVLGRAGRAETPGHAVLQTFSPDNDVLTLAARQDYDSFYEKEIAFRRSSVFPPFCDIVTVTFSSEVEPDAVSAATLFGKAIDGTAKSEYPDVRFVLYGPFRHEIYKLAGKYRMRFIVKCRANTRFREMLGEVLKTRLPSMKNVTVSTDINPQIL